MAASGELPTTLKITASFRRTDGKPLVICLSEDVEWLMTPEEAEMLAEMLKTHARVARETSALLAARPGALASMVANLSGGRA